MRVRLAQHNFRSLTNPELTRLRVRRAADWWVVSDGDDSIEVPSLERWLRYRLGIEAARERIAAVYRIGSEIPVSADDVVIDIGSNVGEVSHYCAGLGATVFAIEPDQRSFDLLIANSSRWPNVTAANVAISDESGVSQFYVSSSSADSSLIEPDAYTRVRTVRTLTLDDFVAEHGVGRVHLIKCDAEGAEPEVLAGAREVLRRTTWVTLDCSAERRGEETVEVCTEFLESCGFAVAHYEAAGGRSIVVGHRIGEDGSSPPSE